MASGGQNRLTKEKVIEQFIEVHGYDFDYSNMVYINTHTPIEVRCKKHDFVFFPTPKNHKSGAKCTMCGREAQIEKAKKPKEKFISEVIEKYGDVYDLENELHRKYKSYKYKPLNWFAGHTECYITDLPIQEIINLGCRNI